MSKTLNRSFIRYMPLNEATKEPSDGLWDVMVDRWWSYVPDKGIMFYRQSPQCNSNKHISETITKQLYPEAEVLFVPRVYLRHRCDDYR